MSRLRVIKTLLLGLLLLGGCLPAAGTARSAAPPSRAECVREGLAPLSVDVRVSVKGLPEVSIPLLRIAWHASPLPAACGLERTVGADVEVRFAKYPKKFSFSAGFPKPWLLFYGSRAARKRHGSTDYEGPAVEAGSLGCIRGVRARLRYRVLAPGGVVVAQKVRSTPARYTSCAELRAG